MNIAQSLQRAGHKLSHNWGRRIVIGIPYLFLILLFTVPFLVVLKISVSETDGIRFQDLTSYTDGVIQLKIKLANYIFSRRPIRSFFLLDTLYT